MSMVLLTQSAFATALLKQTKGADFVNAAKMVLDDSFTPSSTVAKLQALYALGYVEGVLASSIQPEDDQAKTEGLFDLGRDGEVQVFKLIVEWVDGSKTLEVAEGPPLIHALLCVRYGRSHEIRSRGADALIALSAKEAHKIIGKLKKGDQGPESGGANDAIPKTGETPASKSR